MCCFVTIKRFLKYTQQTLPVQWFKTQIETILGKRFLTKRLQSQTNVKIET